MRFYSNKPHNTIYMRGYPPQEKRVIDKHDRSEVIMLNPGVTIRFKPNGITIRDLRRLDRKFRELNPQTPYGSIPYVDDTILSVGFMDFETDDIPTRGYDPMFLISRYDTRRDITDDDYTNAASIDGEKATDAYKEEYREKVEAFLLAHELRGVEIIVDEDAQAEKPWPAYPTGSLNGGQIQAAMNFIEQAGYNPALVLEYETDHENRTGFVAALAKKADEADAIQSDLENLNVGAS